MRKKGFTLIELLIVIAVLAALSLAVISSLMLQLAKARDAKRKVDIHNIKEAVEEYLVDNHCYPPANLVVCKPTDTGLALYILKIPCDPVTGNSYEYEPSGPVCANWYRLYGILENLSDPAIISGIGPSGLNNYYQGSLNAPVPTPGGTPLPSIIPSPGSTPTPTPVSTPTNPPQLFYGCFSGKCLLIQTLCSPRFDNPSCNGAGNCGTPGAPLNECVPI